jgi:AcrR family transcriptional regulator
VPRPKQRTAALRDRLLRAAVSTLLRAGAAGFTTREVAREARTSPPAVYELFGDKAGLVREMFFEGFRRLRRHFDALAESRDARADLVATVLGFRAFILANPELSKLMFMRRFADFDPGPADREAGLAVRGFIVARVQRAIDAGVLAGDATDASHVLVSMTQGLAATELAGWLGSSRAARERRWRLAIDALLDGLAPAGRPRGRR